MARVSKLEIDDTNQIIQLGNYRPDSDNFSNPQTGRIYSISGICPTLNTMQGGDRQPKILVGEDTDD